MIALSTHPRTLSRLLPPLAGLSVTLALGAVGPAEPGLWQLLSPTALMPLLGVVLAGCAGLIAYELAQRTTGPAQAPALAALPATLVAAALPGIGVPALLGALCLASFVAWRDPDHGLHGFAGQCAAALGLAAACLDSEVFGSMSAVAMLSLAAFLTRQAAFRPANDNPSMERLEAFSWLPVVPGYAIESAGIRQMGPGE
jgi:hypothetical protein